MLRLIEDRIDHFGAHMLGLGWVTSICGVKRDPPFHYDTPVGRIHATTTCRVTITGKGLDLALTAKEARELADRLSTAALMVEQHKKVVRGENVHRVVVRDGVATLTIRNQTFTLRQQSTRPPARGYQKSCDRCRKKFETGEKHWSSYRVDDRGWGPKLRLGERRLCLACFDACIVDETPRIEAVK